MRTYTVTWTIQIDAESEREAALIALHIQRDEHSDATVFDVAPFDGSAEPVCVDLQYRELHVNTETSKHPV